METFIRSIESSRTQILRRNVRPSTEILEYYSQAIIGVNTNTKVHTISNGVLTVNAGRDRDTLLRIKAGIDPLLLYGTRLNYTNGTITI